MALKSWQEYLLEVEKRDPEEEKLTPTDLVSPGNTDPNAQEKAKKILDIADKKGKPLETAAAIARAQQRGKI